MNYINHIIINKSIASNFSFKFERGEHKNESYEAFITLDCDNPLCTCRDIWIIAKSNDSEIKYKIPLNIKKRRINEARQTKLTIMDLNFAKSFVTELSDEDWNSFNSYYYSKKALLTEKADINKLEANFDVDQIENHGFMTGYYEILPFSRPIEFIHAGTKYIIDDQYCLNQNCNCSHSILTIMEVKKDNIVDTANSIAVLYEYNKQEWEIEKDPFDNTQFIEDLMLSIKHKISNLCDILKKRHNDLRILYSNFRKRNNLTTTIFNKTKIGRNEPCPCGSGKKYKKCCGAIKK